MAKRYRYYDPEKALLVPIATELGKGAYKLGKKGKAFIKETFAEKYLWIVFPIFLFAIGLYVLWVIYKSRVAHIADVFNEFIHAPWKFSLFGLIWEPNLEGVKKWLLGPFSAFLPPSPSEQEQKTLLSFTQDFQIWIILWGAVCGLIAMWLYSQKQERLRMRRMGWMV